MIIRIVFLVISMSSLCGFLFSQLPTPIVESWRLIQPKDEEFVVSAPITLNEVRDQEAKESKKYFGSINGAYLYVFSDSVTSPKYFQKVDGFLKMLGQSFLSEKDLKQSREFQFLDKFGYWHSFSYRRSKTRIYIAQAVSKSTNDAVATRFISSFKLSSQAIERNGSRPETDEKKDEPNNKQKGRVTNSPSGIGSGSAKYDRPGDPDSPRPKTAPLRLLTKPKPLYTDIAKFYEISGTVILRVTFLGSGEIGVVTPVKELPFGLTENAIEAAKRIRFEPATSDGAPLDVVRRIEFSFLIY